MRRLKALIRHLALLPTFLSTWGRIHKISSQTRLFCFFPYYQTGGSERVHADILASIHDLIPKDQVVIFFTKPSKSATFKDFFYSAGTCFEITELDRSRYRPLLLRSISRVINRTKSAVVFGANTTFLYEVLPAVKTSVKVVDLTHSFVPESQNPVERASLPYVNRLDHRIIISQKVKEDYEALYEAHGLMDESWRDRLEVVPNRLSYPRWDLAEKHYEVPPLKILFVGRNSPEKRIPLLGYLASALRGEQVVFTLVGPDLSQSIRPEHREYLNFAGEITDELALAERYKEHHVILITSQREGFPLVLAEGMAHGTVPVATDVGGISEHVVSGKTGFLIENSDDENVIVENLVSRLLYLLKNPELLKTLGQEAQKEAYRSFDPATFASKWQALLSR